MAYDIKQLAIEFISTRKAALSAQIVLQEANRLSIEADARHKAAEQALQEIAQYSPGNTSIPDKEC